MPTTTVVYHSVTKVRLLRPRPVRLKQAGCPRGSVPRYGWNNSTDIVIATKRNMSRTPKSAAAALTAGVAPEKLESVTAVIAVMGIVRQHSSRFHIQPLLLVKSAIIPRYSKAHRPVLLHLHRQQALALLEL